MNIINNYCFQPTCLTLLLFSFCMSLRGTCQNDLTVIQLRQLSARISQTKIPIPDLVLNDVVSNLRLSLPGISHEPDYKTTPSM